jgi:FkbM family methyltransferase
MPPFWNRTLSRLVAAYPPVRGQTRLRRITSPWLVGHLPGGTWMRVSGVVDAEWKFLQAQKQDDATTQVIRSLVTPGSTFVDVGANVGRYTLLAASLGARVVAYEPTPAVFHRFQENVAVNNFQGVQLVNSAVTEKAGTLSLYLSPDDPEANNLFGGGEQCIEVPAVALDEDLAARAIERVHVLKIDAEGSEPLVLDGAARLLASSAPPTILIEVNPVTLKIAGFAPSDVFHRLESHGYRCTEFERIPYKGQFSRNILATPPSTAP